MEYTKYKTEDFIIDPDFRNWVLEPTAQSNVFWKKWVKENPEKLGAVREAKKVIQAMAKLEFQPPENSANEIWENVKEIAAEENDADSPVIPLNPDAVLGIDKGDKPSNLAYLKIAIITIVIFSGALLLHWVYSSNGSLNLSESETIEETIVKSNPRGQKSSIILSDGTKIMLNSASRITYGSGYGKTNRIVNLEGEALFEVAEDDEKPFQVITSQLSSTALGTSFNISAYPGEKEEISLLTGKLLVERNGNEAEQKILDAGEMIRLDENSQLIKDIFLPEEGVMWVEGILYLKDTPFEETIALLERWYAVNIVVENDPKQTLSCNGKFDNEYLSNVLTSLGYSAGFDFRIDHKTVYIKFNTTPM